MNEQINFSRAGRRPGGSLRPLPGGPFGRALAFVAGGVILVAGLFVSAIVFSVLLVAGVAAGGWFWWKTRGLRRELGERMQQMQQQMQRMQAGEGLGKRAVEPSADVLEGDFIREADEPAKQDPRK